MELTRKQEEGLKIAVQRYKNHEPYTCIAGYAGTGKSTLVKFIISALGVSDDDVCYVAYTGKASIVLKEKGCPNAMTAHKLLYQSYQRNDGTFYHKIRRPIYPYKVIVVDEVSMLPLEMWDLLLSHGIYVLALGDPGQLPPIGQPNEVLASPHIFLDEIMRQAQESEIIRLTMDIRAGKPLQVFSGEEVKIINKGDVDLGMYTWADQTICATNALRRNINNYMRKTLFDTDSPDPVVGDRMICLSNYWDTVNENGDCLVNGSMGTIDNIRYNRNHYVLHPQMLFDFTLEGEESDALHTFKALNADFKLLHEGEPTVTKKNFRTFPKMARPLEFDYGYAITCWKSQGSEYNKVLLFEEGFPFTAVDHQKYLYTGATRACSKLIIVKK